MFSLEKTTHHSGALYRGVITHALCSYIKKPSTLITFGNILLRSTTFPCLTLTSRRKISTISWKLASPLKKKRVFKDISRSHWQQVRQGHTQKEKASEEGNESHESKEHKKNWEEEFEKLRREWTREEGKIKKYIFFGSLGMSATFLLFWKDTLNKLFEENQNGEKSKDISVAQDLINELQKVNELIGNNNLINSMRNLIEKTKQQHEEEIKKLGDGYEELRCNYEGRLAQLNREQKKSIDQQKKEYNKTINDLKEKYRETLSDHWNNQIIQQVVGLYEQCNNEESCCGVLTKLLKGKETVRWGDEASLSPKSMNVLKAALQLNLNPSVTRLNFYGSNINEGNGLISLMQGLKNNETIISLDLGCTDIGPTEVSHIAEMLRENSTLRELSLYFGHLKDDDLSPLKKALMDNQTLEKLDLRFTKITDTEKQKFKEQFGIEILLC